MVVLHWGVRGCILKSLPHCYCCYPTGSKYWIFVVTLLGLLGVYFRAAGTLPIFSTVRCLELVRYPLHTSDHQVASHLSLYIPPTNRPITIQIFYIYTVVHTARYCSADISLACLHCICAAASVLHLYDRRETTVQASAPILQLGLHKREESNDLEAQSESLHCASMTRSKIRSTIRTHGETFHQSVLYCCTWRSTEKAVTLALPWKWNRCKRFQSVEHRKWALYWL